MKIETLKKYVLGDTVLEYQINEDTQMVGMRIYPVECEKDLVSHREIFEEIECVNFGYMLPCDVDPLVNIRVRGDKYTRALGRTLRSSGAMEKIKYKDQTVNESDEQVNIITTLTHSDGWEIYHYVKWTKGTLHFEVYSEINNTTDNDFTVELVTSCSLGGITPFDREIARERLNLHRFRSSWSAEARHDIISFEDLHLERQWLNVEPLCERFGRLGSKAVDGFFPFAAIEDTKAGVFWGLQLSWAGSWQIEVYRDNDFVSLSGGLTDREFGHWSKNIKAGTKFSTPHTLVSTAKCDFDDFCQRLTNALESEVENGPESEQTLPITFNEFCTTWGAPSHENILKIIDALKGMDIKYLVIDSGWYRREGGASWENSMGDWDVNQEQFPNGIKETSDAIRKAGMIPGIWFEIEACGNQALCYNDTDTKLKLDGYLIEVDKRRFWDLNNPWVKKYIDEKVIKFIKDNGFSYLKMDGNCSYGVGVDGCESIGEGSRKQIERFYDFFTRIKKEIPDLIIENCAAGGMRIEPSLLSRTAMGSFSDAHELPEIPILAANVHRVMLPRQSQIWAVLRASDSILRLRYSMINTFLGRPCLSGDVFDLSEEQRKVIIEGIDFYNSVSDIIKSGHSKIYQNISPAYRRPTGTQAVVRENTKKTRILIVLHAFAKGVGDLNVTIPKGYKLIGIYGGNMDDVTIKDDLLICNMQEEFMGKVILLEKKKLTEE